MGGTNVQDLVDWAGHAVTDQPPQKSETPDAPKGGEKGPGYPKLAGENPTPPAEKAPAPEKSPTDKAPPTEKTGYPALAQAEGGGSSGPVESAPEKGAQG